MIKSGHTCLGVAGPDGMTFIAGDRNDSLLWSRNKGASEGRLYSWSPWGNGNPVRGLTGFNGERPDPLSGSYHLGNGYRAYNPVLMRFNCPDNLSPFGAGGINPYAYCAGDPINHIDPSGHMSWQSIVGIVASTIGLTLAGITAGSSIAAAGGIVAAISAAPLATAAGGLAVVADVTGIAGIITEKSNPSASAVLGWVSFGTGIAGMIAGIGQALPKIGRTVQREYIELRSRSSSAFNRESDIEKRIDTSIKELGGDPDSPTDRILFKNHRVTRNVLRVSSTNPSHFYRGSRFPLQLPEENISIDDRLVDMFLHTGRRQGSRGIVQSFSSNINVASRFAGKSGTIYKVPAEGNVFISTAQLINDHADRLILNDRVRRGTVAKAIEYYLDEDESEYFWLSGTNLQV